jgi:predicted metalloprotease
VRISRLRIWAAVATAAVVTVLSACGSPAQTKPAPAPTPAATASDAGTSIDGTQVDQLPAVPTPTVTPSPPDLSTTAGQTTFLRGVFADIQAVWSKEFTSSGLSYSPARLTLFQSQITTACGRESAEVGPFYCSGDHTVYLDLQFFTSMAKQFGVTGDFAEAYVVAHEVGHHIQNLTGITGRIAAADQSSPSAGNALSVRAELQADCFAGVWAHSTYERHLLDAGDIEEALHAAQVVGDDYLARARGAAVDPDSWTHGSSAQRQRWFTSGYKDGRPDACDTFAAASP